MFKFEFSDGIYTEKTDGVTRFRIDGCGLNKWLHQNKADIIDCFDGCLLDNYIASTARGYAFIYEHFVNCWTSDYLFEFVPYKAKKAVDRLFNEWDRNYNQYLEECNE